MPHEAGLGSVRQLLPLTDSCAWKPSSRWSLARTDPVLRPAHERRRALTEVVSKVDRLIRGALALAEGDPGRALPFLRRAVGAWQEQEAPYEVATLNVLIGQAYRALEDEDGARIQFAAARETFTRLGARPDLARLVRSALPVTPPPAATA